MLCHTVDVTDVHGANPRGGHWVVHDYTTKGPGIPGSVLQLPVTPSLTIVLHRTHASQQSTVWFAISEDTSHCGLGPQYLRVVNPSRGRHAILDPHLSCLQRTSRSDQAEAHLHMHMGRRRIHKRSDSHRERFHHYLKSNWEIRGSGKGVRGSRIAAFLYGPSGCRHVITLSLMGLPIASVGGGRAVRARCMKLGAPGICIRNP
ncbi:hypothetical protein C8Q74DRAFT_724507 [Fomes fomentarius]|nr:hypothetical protein C8Q74DRAFT_724507 [Fomes fomentarius]